MSYKYAMTHAQIAAQLNITPEEVERIEYSAVAKLRRNRRLKRLLKEQVRLQRIPLDVDHYVTGNAPEKELIDV